MDLASALLKQIIVRQDITTWASLRRNYLTPEYTSLYDRISSFVDRYNKIPTFEELKFDVKSKQIQQRIAIVEQLSIDAEPDLLLEFLKTDYAQRLSIAGIEKFLEDSIAFDSVKNTIEGIQNIALDLERKIDVEDDQESMQRIELFEPEEVMSRYIKLGFNTEFDAETSYTPEDMIMFGGRRGAGKSLVCANTVANLQEEGKSSLYFTVEMNQRDIIQRVAAIGSDVSAKRLRLNNLHSDELQRVAKWWASRYQGGEELYKEAYNLHVSFKDFHKKLSTLPLKENRFDVIYDPDLTVARIRAECERKVPLIKPAAIIVDYINVVKISKIPSKKGQFDWQEQIQVAKFLKQEIAQKYGVPVLCPYQIDASGEARFAKGILDSADAAFTLDAHNKDDRAMSFNCTKDRRNEEKSFTSAMDWDSLKIGPDSAVISAKVEDDDDEGGGKPASFKKESKKSKGSYNNEGESWRHN